MHEVCITMAFIEKHGELVAERYLAHDITEHYRALKFYEKKFGPQKDLPIPDDEKEAIRNEYARACEKLGAKFGKPRGWAVDAMSGKVPSIMDLEKDVGLDYLRDSYGYASEGIHANIMGIYNRPSQPPYTHDAIAGPSVYGLGDAIELAAHTAVYTFLVAMRQWPSLDALAAFKLLQRLFNETCDYGAKTQHELEQALGGVPEDAITQTSTATPVG